MKRMLVVCVSVLALACGGGGNGGPTEPQIPNIAGNWDGQELDESDTCDPSAQGTIRNVSIPISQTGSAITVVLLGGQLQGSVQSSGSFQASGTIVSQGVVFQVTMQGRVQGNRLTASENVQGSFGSATCAILLSFDLTRR